MPLENNIKVQSSAEIKEKIKVNISELDPYEWASTVASDRGDATIWVKEDYNASRAETIGSADVSKFARVDLSELNNQVAGTYPVYTYFKGLEASYEVTVKPMEMSIAVSNMTTDYIYGEAITFDGDCYATYSKESLSGYVEPSSVTPGEEVAGQRTDVTVTYYDNYYDIGDHAIYSVNIHYPVDDNSVVIDFKKDIPDFSEWTSSYTEHIVDFGYVIGSIVASRQGEDQPISDEPVIKSGPITFRTDEARRYIDGISLSFTQWGSKSQTYSLEYSEDGGIT